MSKKAGRARKFENYWKDDKDKPNYEWDHMTYEYTHGYGGSLTNHKQVSCSYFGIECSKHVWKAVAICEKSPELMTRVHRDTLIAWATSLTMAGKSEGQMIGERVLARFRRAQSLPSPKSPR